jgi:uncharacterized membrane protein
MLQFIKAFFLLILLDIPWLYLQTSSSIQMFSAIQGQGEVVMRLWPALIVYGALAYLLLLQKSVIGSALSGLAVYAVYDFTNLVVFKDYKLSFAIQDTLWGGVLFGTAFWILQKIL